MRNHYICIRDNSHVGTANDSRLPLKRRNSFILMVVPTTDSQEFVSAKRGEAVLFFTLLVLILNHSLFGQNEKPFNPVGGNSKYNLQNVATSKNPALLASNGCWRLGVVATEKPKVLLPEYIRIGPSRIIVFVKGRANYRNWLNAENKAVLTLQHKGIPI